MLFSQLKTSDDITVPRLDKNWEVLRICTAAQFYLCHAHKRLVFVRTDEAHVTLVNGGFREAFLFVLPAAQQPLVPVLVHTVQAVHLWRRGFMGSDSCCTCHNVRVAIGNLDSLNGIAQCHNKASPTLT